MGNRKTPASTVFGGREQSHLKQFLFKLFEDGCPPEEALQAMRNRFDAEDFARARAMGPKLDGSASKDARGPRGKS